MCWVSDPCEAKPKLLAKDHMLSLEFTDANKQVGDVLVTRIWAEQRLPFVLRTESCTVQCGQAIIVLELVKADKEGNSFKTCVIQCA